MVSSSGSSFSDLKGVKERGRRFGYVENIWKGWDKWDCQIYLKGKIHKLL